MGIFNYTIPVLMAAVFVVALIKKVNIFEEFVAGVGDGFKVVLKSRPFSSHCLRPSPCSALRAEWICSMRACVLSQAFGHSGRADDACRHAPLSGSGSIALLNDYLIQYGPDSEIGRMASVLAASTETTFCHADRIHGQRGHQKTGRALPAAVFADLCAIFGAVITVRLFL